MMIPDDVIPQILLNLPVKSLSRFRYVCKSWHDLISNHTFVQDHRNHADSIPHGRENYIIYSHPNKFEHLVDDETTTDSITAPLSTFPVGIPIVFYNKYVDVMGQCDGMLCVRVSDLEPIEEEHIISVDVSIFLWNPTMGTFVKLPYLPKDHGRYALYGLGHNPILDDYFVCRIPSKTSQDWNNLAQVFYLKSNSWRIICDLEQDYNIPCFANAIFLKGNLYWLTHHDIICFNAIKETFVEIRLPLPLYREDNFGNPILDIINGSICILKRCRNGDVYCWVCNDDGTWIKICHIPLEQSSRPVNGNRVVLHEPLGLIKNSIYLSTDESVYSSAGEYKLAKRFVVKENPESDVVTSESEEVLFPGNVNLERKYLLEETLISPSSIMCSRKDD